MQNRHLIWFGFATVLVLLMGACGANTATPVAPTAVPQLATSAAPTAVPQLATSAPRTGDLAPDFTLLDQNGNAVHLADELQENRVVVLNFNHGHT